MGKGSEILRALGCSEFERVNNLAGIFFIPADAEKFTIKQRLSKPVPA